MDFHKNMRIQRVQNNYSANKSISPAFGSWTREVVKEGKPNVDLLIKDVIHRNNTCLCREPITILGPIKHYWENFRDYIVEKYKNVPKVNVYSFGCSNSSEPISLVIGLKSALRDKEFSKYMPIKASDYDPVAIKHAKSGVISIGWKEAVRIDELTNGQFGKFFYRDDPMKNLSKIDYFKIGNIKNLGIMTSLLSDEEKYFYINPEITNNIEYKIADVMNEVDEIEPNNSIVNVSNFWIYLGREKGEELANKLYDKLGNNSCVRIGGFDVAIRADKMLHDAGFISYVYEK